MLVKKRKGIKGKKRNGGPKDEKVVTGGVPLVLGSGIYN